MARLDQAELWLTTLPSIQAIINSSISAITEQAANEIIYGFQPKQPLDLIIEAFTELGKPSVTRIKAADALAFASMIAKHNYDKHHQATFLQEGNFALLRLHKGYNIPANKALTCKLG